MGRYYLEDKKVAYVSDGRRSVSEHSNIQPFLEQKYLFRKAYFNKKLHYVLWLNTIIQIFVPFRSLPINPLAVKNLLKFKAINREK